jgi:cell division septation protein DedD
MADSRGGRTLNRDFKDVRRHAPGAPGQPFSGWGGFGLGLGLGLSAALAVHLYHRNRLPDAAEPVPAAVQAPASAAASDDGAIAGTGATAEPDLDFYDMLPRQEVEVPGRPPQTSSARPRTPLPTGDAVLQAGSFKQSTEAEKMQAQLALVGIAAKIQRASVDDETWYRVRIGPIETVEELRVVQAKLREAEITATAVTPAEESPLP